MSNAYDHENTVYGAYGEFEPVADDFDWDAYYADIAAAEETSDSLEYFNPVEQGYFDNDPDIYGGCY